MKMQCCRSSMVRGSALSATRSTSTRSHIGPFFEPNTNETITKQPKWWHGHHNTTVIDQVFADAQERMERYNDLGKMRGRLNYNEKRALHVIKSPGVQKFLDKLQEDMLAELPDRKTEADEETERQMMIQSGKEKLLGLDPFNYSIEESREKEVQDREYPMGNSVETSNTVINKLGRRTPLDLFHMYRTGGEKGFGPAGNFLKMHFAQSLASFKEKRMWIYNRSFDQNVSDRAFSGKKLAAELQLKYLKHFELISEGRWNVLLDYASDAITSEAMHACQGLERETVRSFFDVKLVSNNKKPKVMSFFEFEQQGMEFQQVLVRFDMNVECLSFENDPTATADEVLSDLSAAPNDVAELKKERMLKYAVFERRADDFLSKYRLIGTVSEEEMEENKRSVYDIGADKGQPK